MSKVILEPEVFTESIRKLERIAVNHASETPLSFTFQGELRLMQGAEELLGLMEQGRMLWFNLAGFESRLQEETKAGIQEEERALAGSIGKEAGLE